MQLTAGIRKFQNLMLKIYLKIYLSDICLMVKLIVFYSIMGIGIGAISQSMLAKYLHPDLKYICAFLLFQSYLTLQLAQKGQKNEGEKFVQFQTASFAIRFILSILFLAFFIYTHTTQIYLFVGNFFVLYLCSSNFEIFGLLRNLRRF